MSSICVARIRFKIEVEVGKSRTRDAMRFDFYAGHEICISADTNRFSQSHILSSDEDTGVLAAWGCSI